MSTWRRKALEFLPEMRLEIESSNSPAGLWIEITFAFFDAADAANEDFIKRTLSYLSWCASDVAGLTTQQAVYCGFLEDIANKKKLWPMFNKWFNKAQFEKYKDPFQYTLSDRDFKALENEFYQR